MYMWPNVYQPERIYPGLRPGAGALRDLSEMRLPGWGGSPLEMYVQNGRLEEAPALPEKPAKVGDREAVRLARAIIARALRDARTSGAAARNDRESAVGWLKSGIAAEWLAVLGLGRIRQSDIELFLAECQKDQKDPAISQ